MLQSYKLKAQSPKKMRYLTIGDYFKAKDGWDVVTADLGYSDYNFLILLHELIELYLTQKRGITEPKIKKFDEWFEREKTKGRFQNIIEAGFHPKAPYRREHVFATKIERLIAKELKVNWGKYYKTMDQIWEVIEKYLTQSRKN